MFSESDPEIQIEQQVDRMFDEVALEFKDDRKLIQGMAALSLIELINEERLASQEEQARWAQEGKDDRKSPPSGRSAIGTVILGGFTGLGMGMVGGFVPADELEGETRLIKKPAELSETPDRLDLARQNLAHAITILPDAYGLTLKEARGVEAKARALRYPKYL